MATDSSADSAAMAKFRLSGVYVRRASPPCEADVGASQEDYWWRSVINRVPVNNGLEPVRRRHRRL